MNNKWIERTGIPDERELMLIEEDINALEYFRCLSPKQRVELIAFVYEISQVLYSSYFESNESV